MSNPNDLEKKLSTITIGSLSNYLSTEDYKNTFYLLIQTRPDQLKFHIKEILTTIKVDQNIHKFLTVIVDILKSDINNWNNSDNIKAIFNEFEDVFPTVSLNNCGGKPDKSLQHKWNSILETVFDNYLSEVDQQLQKLLSNPSPSSQDPSLYQLSSVLLNFTQLLDINHYEPILFPMVKFGENLLRMYNGVPQLQPLIVEFILHINHRLVNYLAVVPGNPVSKGLREAIYIYSNVRNNIVALNYTHPEIITKALAILEHRSRFFGLTADAIPENENHGDYIVVDPLNSAFEDDDVYDDYERFLANLPPN